MRNRRKAVTMATPVVMGLVLSMAIASPAVADASKSYSANCTGYSAGALRSYAAQHVGHYHNGVLVDQWHQGVSTWRTTYHPPTVAVWKIWSSWAIYDSQAYCFHQA